MPRFPDGAGSGPLVTRGVTRNDRRQVEGHRHTEGVDGSLPRTPRIRRRGDTGFTTGRSGYLWSEPQIRPRTVGEVQDPEGPPSVRRARPGGSPGETGVRHHCVPEDTGEDRDVTMSVFVDLLIPSPERFHVVVFEVLRTSFVPLLGTRTAGPDGQARIQRRRGRGPNETPGPGPGETDSLILQ